ncbi:26S proteasome complex subunit DSS1 [Fukomys damarensis]|uniref:26S proteasome complex subunit SEM1 n=1 Tax=Fukomys damarensis TaxID=885580 RepID=A0A091D061_FUKDA|nr:26S proteasome complex subunit DSS1 [Fukomys damarensis]
MSEKKPPVDLGLLEEDDEFEEFPAEDWAGLDEDEDAHVWEDNWDDDNVEDDFSNQLRNRAPTMGARRNNDQHLLLATRQDYSIPYLIKLWGLEDLSNALFKGQLLDWLLKGEASQCAETEKSMTFLGMNQHESPSVGCLLCPHAHANNSEQDGQYQPQFLLREGTQMCVESVTVTAMSLSMKSLAGELFCWPWIYSFIEK